MVGVVNLVTGILAVAMLGQPSDGAVSAPSAAPSALQGPVSVTSCALSISKGGSVVWITFVNRANVVAGEVRVAVSVPGQEPFEIVDRGRFSPNVDIRHAFRPPSTAELTAGGRASCRLSDAHFEDGTAWGSRM